jgi:hypothetical protein
MVNVVSILGLGIRLVCSLAVKMGATVLPKYRLDSTFNTLLHSERQNSSDSILVIRVTGKCQDFVHISYTISCIFCNIGSI